MRKFSISSSPKSWPMRKASCRTRPELARRRQALSHLLLLRGKARDCRFEHRRAASPLPPPLQTQPRPLSGKAAHSFRKNLEAFEIPPHSHSVDLFINLSLSVMVVCRAIPQSLPLFVPGGRRTDGCRPNRAADQLAGNPAARRCPAARLTLPPAAPPSAAAAPPPSLSPAGRRAPPESDGSPPVQAVDFCSK